MRFATLYIFRCTRRAAKLLAPCVLVIAALESAGCDSADPMEDMYNRPGAALTDPMNYTPDMSNADVMGGGIATYNDKAMKQDVDELLVP